MSVCISQLVDEFVRQRAFFYRLANSAAPRAYTPTCLSIIGVTGQSLLSNEQSIHHLIRTRQRLQQQRLIAVSARMELRTDHVRNDFQQNIFDIKT